MTPGRLQPSARCRVAIEQHHLGSWPQHFAGVGADLELWCRAVSLLQGCIALEHWTFPARCRISSLFDVD